MNFTVIIPSRNANNLLPCIKAVREHEPAEEIVVVDDGLPTSVFDGYSPDDFGWGLVQIEGIKPFVFARNVNLGLRYSCDPTTVEVVGGPNPRTIYEPPRFDGVIVLNDDALLTTPGGFTALAAVAKDHPEYGVIAAACDNTGNPNQRPKGIGLREDPRMVCFVCVYIPRRTIERVGLLDERYVGYGMDDDDYCFSVRKAGLKVGIFDHCIVDHRHLTSSYRGNPRAPSDFRPNMRLFIDKWGTDNWNVPRDVALRKWGLA